MNIEEILARLWLIVATSSSFETKDYPNCIVMKQDLKNLLTAYEKEKEDNKELRKYYATRKEVEELREINECLHDSAENYIHKDKIIEKVIEVKDRPVKDEFITATQGKLNTIIDIESLLDKEE